MRRSLATITERSRIGGISHRTSRWAGTSSSETRAQYDAVQSGGHFDRFVEGRLGPQLAELGDDAFQGPPDIKEFPVHHYTKP
jgi:hypothetical protein